MMVHFDRLTCPACNHPGRLVGAFGALQARRCVFCKHMWRVFITHEGA